MPAVVKMWSSERAHATEKKKKESRLMFRNFTFIFSTLKIRHWSVFWHSGTPAGMLADWIARLRPAFYGAWEPWTTERATASSFWAQGSLDRQLRVGRWPEFPKRRRLRLAAKMPNMLHIPMFFFLLFSCWQAGKKPEKFGQETQTLRIRQRGAADVGILLLTLNGSCPLYMG
jgi:hypothetical protein